MWAIALYDYEATCEDEISFNEGEVLEVVRKIVHDTVDDGWWEGRIHDQVGLFPSLVVEECRENGEPLTPEVIAKSMLLESKKVVKKHSPRGILVEYGTLMNETTGWAIIFSKFYHIKVEVCVTVKYLYSLSTKQYPT